MEQNESGQIKGYIIYKEESEDDLKKKQEEDEKLKELIKANQGEGQIDGLQQEEEDESGLNEQTAAIVKKFKGKILKEFIPCFMLSQYEGEQFIEYESFSACVDEYFSQAVKQKEVNKNQSKESAIWSKMNKIKEDQEKRISGLQKEQDLSEFKAILLQKYISEVQAIIDILTVMTNSGISWTEIKRQIKEERKQNNPLANMIYKMNFEKA